MELIPIEHFTDKIDINIKVLKDLWLEDIAIRFTEHELKSVLYHLRTLQIAMDNAEPCGDCVSRQTVKEQMLKYGFLAPDMTVTELIEQLPSVTPQPKTGHWININEGKWNTIPAYKCSECGANADLRDWSGESPFCPWCGAKMVEPQERSDK